MVNTQKCINIHCIDLSEIVKFVKASFEKCTLKNINPL